MNLNPVMLKSCYATTAEVIASVPADRWSAPTPCTEWTVREVTNHLVDALDYFGRVTTGEPPADQAADHLGADPVAAYRAAVDRCLAAFGSPEVLSATHPFPNGPTPGWVIAYISLSESLVHGWDIAVGAGLPYEPGSDVVAAVASFNSGGGQAPPDAFADPVPVPADAPPLVALLGSLGRKVG